MANMTPLFDFPLYNNTNKNTTNNTLVIDQFETVPEMLNILNLQPVAVKG